MEKSLSCDNNAVRIKREILIRVARNYMRGNLDEVDRIPFLMRPKDGTDPSRCCIYKDREIIRYRAMAALGHRVEEETDDSIPLSRYARAAEEREKPEGPVLTVLDLACSACVQSRYIVTEACRGCLARPCTLKCPKKAIVQKNGRAVIDHTQCINCGMCMKVCPYHAIIKVPIPCEEACPVGAISKDKTGKEHIDYDKCIFCGKCVQACPFGAIMERSQIIDVIGALRSERPVVAMVAPSIAGQFPGDMEQIICSMEKLGFKGVAEVASGADATARDEAKELLERLGQGDPVMTTSCCPAYVEAVKKHVPELLQYVSHTPSPMKYTAKWSKKRVPGCITVFIGPCIAKRNEALDDPHTDFVLTFEELGALFVAAGVDVAVADRSQFLDVAGPAGWGFPVTGGVSGAVMELLPEDNNVKPQAIDGLDKQKIKFLKICASGKTPANFFEVMACKGGCVAGPGVVVAPAMSGKKVAEMVEKVTK